MSARRMELAFMGVLTVVCFLLVDVLGVGWAPGRTLPAIALVLVLPGYSLLAAVYPGRRTGIAIRTGLILGISLSLTILVGLGLSVTAGGVQPKPYAAILAGLSLVLLVSAMGQSAPGRPARRWPGMPRGRPLMLLALALLVAAFAVQVDLSAARNSARREGLTELWLVPMAHKAPAAVLGVKNLETHPMSYKLTVTLGRRRIASWDRLDLPPDGTWTRTVAVPSDAPPGRLAATLTGVGNDAAVLGSPLRVWMHLP